MCLPQPVTKKLGVFGRIIDPGLATAEVAGKVWKPAEQILNPGEWEEGLFPSAEKAPNIGRNKGQMPESKSQEQLAQDARHKKAQEAMKKRQATSLLLSDNSAGATTKGGAGNSILTGDFSGLDSDSGPTSQGLKSILGS